MHCLHPLEVRKWSELPDGTKVKSNNYRLVPCGKCIACLNKKRNEWTYRLCMEERFSNYSYFCTLTYDQEHIPITINEGKPYFVFNKADVQKYIKRVRYFISKMDSDIQCSYYCVSEYGSHTHRPHYHLLFFVKNDKSYKKSDMVQRILHDEWTVGNSTVKPTMQANIHYCTKYCLKSIDQLPEDCIDPVFVLASKMHYIGEGAENRLEMQDSNTVFLNGARFPLPRIYRSKLGLAGVPLEESADPRLSPNDYRFFFDEYKKTHDHFNVNEFTHYLDYRLASSERNAIRRSIQRSEKL